MTFFEPLFDPVLFPLHAAAMFVFGTMFGSFFNVVIGRVPRRFNISLPPSHCPTCGTKIRWYDNVPILSQALLGAACRACGTCISWRYGAVEFTTGLLFLGVFLTVRYEWSVFVYVPFVSLLVIATFMDIDHWIIPDSITVTGLLFGLAVSPLGPWLGAHYVPANAWPHWGGAWWGGAANAAIGAALGFGLLWGMAVVGKVIFRREAMGMGDVFLVGMFGAFLGWQGVVTSLLLGCVIGALVAGPLTVLARLRSRSGDSPTDWPEGVDPATREGLEAAVAHFDLHGRDGGSSGHLPFGPYLCVAALIAFFAWEPLMAMLDAFYVAPIREWLEFRRLTSGS